MGDFVIDVNHKMLTKEPFVGLLSYLQGHWKDVSLDIEAVAIATLGAQSGSATVLRSCYAELHQKCTQLIGKVVITSAKAVGYLLCRAIAECDVRADHVAETTVLLDETEAILEQTTVVGMSVVGHMQAFPHVVMYVVVS